MRRRIKEWPRRGRQLFRSLDHREGTPLDVVSLARTTEMVECLRHEDDGCPRCDGSGYQPRKLCTDCGAPAKALQAARAAKSWEEARSLPLYCAGCNSRFAGTRLGSLLD